MQRGGNNPPVAKSSKSYPSILLTTDITTSDFRVAALVMLSYIIIIGTPRSSLLTSPLRVPQIQLLTILYPRDLTSGFILQIYYMSPVFQRSLFFSERLFFAVEGFLFLYFKKAQSELISTSSQTTQTISHTASPQKGTNLHQPILLLTAPNSKA